MQKQLGKIGAVRRDVQGKACRTCGGHTYQLVLRSPGAAEPVRLFARCTKCQQNRNLDKGFGEILWM